MCISVEEMELEKAREERDEAKEQLNNELAKLKLMEERLTKLESKKKPSKKKK